MTAFHHNGTETPSLPGVKLTLFSLFTDDSDDGTLGYIDVCYESRRLAPTARRSHAADSSSRFGNANPMGLGVMMMATGAPDCPAVPKSQSTISLSIPSPPPALSPRQPHAR